MPGNESNWAVGNVHDDGNGQASGLALDVRVGAAGPDSHEPGKFSHPRIPFGACHPAWQTGYIPLTAGAGSVFQPNLYGPELPYWWDLRTVSVWGWTAGTVTLYMNSQPNGEQVGVATTPGQFTFSAQMMMSPQDSLVLAATGITGSVFFTMRAIEVETAWLAEYLM